VTYEGTNQVKDTKINQLVHDYELFTLLENENISSMYDHFNDIINALKGLGKVYTNQPDCPKLKKKKDKKKAMITTWSDIDDSSSDEDENEEIANIAFMAMEDENEVCSSTLSYNDLQNEY
ncbi:UBN2 domain-containing protein, partial [Cephalotus follicularis]